MQHLPISDPALITSFYQAFSSYKRDEAMLQEATSNSSLLKKNIWEAWVDDRALDFAVACKQGRHLPPSTQHSWEVTTEPAHPAPPAPQPQPQPQPHFSPSRSAERELQAEDVGARAWASISVQQLPPLIDVPALLAPPSQPIAPWDGNTDALLGGEPCTAACSQTDVAAYRAACQQLAWRSGRLLTFRAMLTGSERQQQQASMAAAPASPVVLEPKWDFVFSCLEAASKLGKSITYAMAAAA